MRSIFLLFLLVVLGTNKIKRINSQDLNEVNKRNLNRKNLKIFIIHKIKRAFWTIVTSANFHWRFQLIIEHKQANVKSKYTINYVKQLNTKKLSKKIIR